MNTLIRIIGGIVFAGIYGALIYFIDWELFMYLGMIVVFVGVALAYYYIFGIPHGD